MKAYIIKNKDLEVAILPYGATVQSIKFKGVDVALGYATLEDYKKNADYLGATVGRCANRISGASFVLNGKKYTLSPNEPDRGHLHGGFCGLDKKTWECAARRANSVTLQTALADGEEGYPGAMEIAVEFTLRENALRITYRAKSDQDTLFNPTNHTYFNLSGCGAPTVEDHLLWINADHYTPVDRVLDPTGEIRPVAGTPFDFRQEKPIGREIDAQDEQLAFGGGYDHNFCINGEGFRRAAALYSPKSGIRMECFTDLPGLQVYTANSLEALQSKSGPLSRRMGVCLETQFYPNSPNRPRFPSPVLRAGEGFQSVTEYRFEIEMI